mmetsp:Transcript_43268/g.97791  ORF Transcript_43268/g.97791 Transcript_43268/m.97791 type:complete len:517 (-) Transcript_43268:652-2202(-)
MSFLTISKRNLNNAAQVLRQGPRAPAPRRLPRHPALVDLAAEANEPATNLLRAIQPVPIPEIAKEAVAPMDAAAEARSKIINLGAGPGLQPEAALRKMSAAVMNYAESGMGIMELSHRDAGGPIQTLMRDTKEQVKGLLDVPETHEVVLMHGGAWAQFAAVPMNLAGDPASQGFGCTSWVRTGNWGDIARGEAEPHLPTHTAASFDPSQPGGLAVPDPSQWEVRPDAAFVHLCANETVTGIEFHQDPDLAKIFQANHQAGGGDAAQFAPRAEAKVMMEGVAAHGVNLGAGFLAEKASGGPPPLVGDFTSCLLSRPVDISKYGVVYASGGKNVGPSGVCVAIVKKQLVEARKAHPLCPAVMNYQRVLDQDSRLNTPATFNILALHEVLKWLEHSGGVPAAQQWAEARAGAVYEAIDSSGGFYVNKVVPTSRSRINVPFRIANQKQGDGQFDLELEAQFATEAAARGIEQVHVSLPPALLGPGASQGGGLRLSMYNALPVEQALRAAKFMDEFRHRHA